MRGKILKKFIASKSEGSGPISRRVFYSAMWGILFGCIIIGPVMFLSHYLRGGPTPPVPMILMMGFGIFYFPLIFMLASPFFVVAIAIAASFKESIEKHIMAWCCVAPFVVWLEVFSVLTWFNNAVERKGNFLETFSNSLLGTESLLPFFSAAVSSAIFYSKSIREKNSRNIKL